VDYHEVVQVDEEGPLFVLPQPFQRHHLQLRGAVEKSHQPFAVLARAAALVGKELVSEAQRGRHLLARLRPPANTAVFSNHSTAHN
jgi:hypothetical protein